MKRILVIIGQKENAQSIIKYRAAFEFTLFTLFKSKCLSSGSCLILSGNLPSKLATIFQPDPFEWK